MTYLQAHGETLHTAKLLNLIKYKNDEKTRRLLYSIKSLQQFNDKYISGTKLVALFGLKYNRFYDILLSNQIFPEAESEEPFGSVHFYKKDEIFNSNIEKIILSIFHSKNEQKSENRTKWLTANETTDILSVYKKKKHSLELLMNFNFKRRISDIWSMSGGVRIIQAPVKKTFAEGLEVIDGANQLYFDLTRYF